MAKYHHITVRCAPTPEQRLTNLLAYFGWQGGTVYGHIHTTSGDVRTWRSYSGARRFARTYALRGGF